MSEYGSLKALLSSSVFQLMQTKGIGEAKAVQLKALFALTKRAHAPQFVMRYPIADPFHAYLYVREKFKSDAQEQILVVLRDARGAAYHHKHLAIGKINCVGIDPKELLSYAITNNAVSLILCHNHPTGNVTPSKDDLAMTKRLGDAAALMGIRLDDHLIISRLDYTSFYNEKLIKNREIY